MVGEMIISFWFSYELKGNPELVGILFSHVESWKKSQKLYSNYYPESDIILYKKGCWRVSCGRCGWVARGRGAKACKKEREERERSEGE